MPLTPLHASGHRPDPRLPVRWRLSRPGDQRRTARVPVLLLPGRRASTPRAQARAKAAEANRPPASSAARGRLRNPLNAAAQGGQDTIPRDRFRWSVWAQGAFRREPSCASCATRCFAFFAEVAGKSARQLHARRASGHRRADRADAGRRHWWIGLRLDQADADTKGDLFEHVLKQIKTGGRTRPVPHAAPHHPRHRRDASTRRSARPSTTRRRARPASWSPLTTTSGSPIPSPDGIESVELDGKTHPARPRRQALRRASVAHCRSRPSSATTSTRRWCASPP